ncbi:copper-binding protein [Methylocystis sp. L43]|jgi:Cu(I)/Ag(I) efflux system protein CusF|uniref:copper-binding protein n=1 Tax=unclassified Methylocystis TaxID=2625913 RepID=UPI0018C26D5B|nr:MULTISPECIES: copper-binding protein [unclassified Methylocystis]MBG0797692.1 copper-binding protein [Methylocystis sp. L43]MBG0805298.1 copper-binding protein [Methylocystis sp. H15]
MKTTRYAFARVAACAAISIGIGGASASAGAPRDTVAQATENAEKTTGQGEGVVRAVDADDRRLMITHGPIAGPLEMSPMTMAFRVAPGVDLSSLSKGMKIKFTISRDAKGLYVIEDVRPEKP